MRVVIVRPSDGQTHAVLTLLDQRSGWEDEPFKKRRVRVGGGDGVHRCFLLGFGRCFSCHAWHVPTCRTPPGEGGVARCKGGVYPPLEREPKAERKGRSAAEVCTSEARKIGETLAPREGSALSRYFDMVDV